MMKLKAPIRHDGKVFRTKREMQWAVFLDLCNADYEYKPRKFAIRIEGDDQESFYTPNFLVHNVEGRVNGDLYMHVAPRLDEDEARKISAFVDMQYEMRETEWGECETPITTHPTYIVGDIPEGDTIEEVTENVSDIGNGSCPGLEESDIDVPMFNFYNIDGDRFAAHPGVNNNGNFQLFGDDSSYMVDRNDVATMMAVKVARNVTL